VVDAVFSTLRQDFGMGSVPNSMVLVSSCVPLTVGRRRSFLNLCERADAVDGVAVVAVRDARWCCAVAALRWQYGGCSAGARGALFSAQHVVSSVLPQLPHPPQRFAVLLDSALWMDAPPFANVTSLQEEAALGFAAYGANATVDPACLAEYGTSDTAWKCLYGQYALPFLSKAGIPFLLHSFLYDRWQLTSDFGVSFLYPASLLTAAQLAYAESFRQLTQTREQRVLLHADGVTPLDSRFLSCQYAVLQRRRSMFRRRRPRRINPPCCCRRASRTVPPSRLPSRTSLPLASPSKQPPKRFSRVQLQYPILYRMCARGSTATPRVRLTFKVVWHHLHSRSVTLHE
jgi:hypothetical protein